MLGKPIGKAKFILSYRFPLQDILHIFLDLLKHCLQRVEFMVQALIVCSETLTLLLEIIDLDIL
jgi:hypothetical protein